MSVGLRITRLNGMSIAKKNVSSSIAGTSLWMNIVRLVRVDADGEPVGGDVDHALADVGGLVGAGREGVLVGDEEVAVVLVLQRQAVLDAADVVAEVELAGGGVAGEDAFFVRGGGHGGEVIPWRGVVICGWSFVLCHWSLVIGEACGRDEGLRTND